MPSSFEKLEKCKDAITGYLSQVVDPIFSSTELTDFILTLTKELVVKKRIESLEMGLPPEILNLTNDKDNPICIDKAQAETISRWCVSSSTIYKFRPLTGCDEKPFPVEYLSDRLSRPKHGYSKYLRNIEQDFFSNHHEDLEYYKVEKNTLSWINPSIPTIMATPDGLLKDSSKRIVGVIELKIPKKAVTIEQLVTRTKQRDSCGLKFQQDVKGDLQVSVKKGHPWYCQWYLQCIALRVRIGYLAFKTIFGWVGTFINFEESEAQRMLTNIKQFHSEVMLYNNSIEKQNELDTLKKKAGRPPKLTKRLPWKRKYPLKFPNCQATTFLTQPDSEVAFLPKHANYTNFSTEETNSSCTFSEKEDSSVI